MISFITSSRLFPFKSIGSLPISLNISSVLPLTYLSGTTLVKSNFSFLLFPTSSFNGFKMYLYLFSKISFSTVIKGVSVPK